jgi:hypothetical protein
MDIIQLFMYLFCLHICCFAGTLFFFATLFGCGELLCGCHLFRDDVNLALLMSDGSLMTTGDTPGCDGLLCLDRLSYFLSGRLNLNLVSMF